MPNESSTDALTYELSCFKDLEPLHADYVQATERLLLFKGYSSYVSLAIGILGFGLNTMLVLIMAKLLRMHRLSWKRYYLVLHTAVVDAFGSLIVVGASVLNILVDMYPATHSAFQLIWELKIAWDAAQDVVIYIPAINFVTLCLFQFTAVRWPIVYATKITKRLCLKVILLDWILILSLGTFLISLSIIKQPLGDAHKITVGYEVFRCAFLAMFIGLVSVTYIYVRYVTFKRRMRIEKTVIRYVRSLGIHVIIYVSTSALLFINEVIYTSWLLPTLAIRSIASHQMLSCGDRVAQMKGWRVIFQTMTANYVIIPIWLFRLILDPLCHMFGNPVIHRYLFCRRLEPKRPNYSRSRSTMRSSLSYSSTLTRTPPPAKEGQQFFSRL